MNMTRHRIDPCSTTCSKFKTVILNTYISLLLSDLNDLICEIFDLSLKHCGGVLTSIREIKPCTGSFMSDFLNVFQL